MFIVYAYIILGLITLACIARNEWVETSIKEIEPLSTLITKAILIITGVPLAIYLYRKWN